jgi:hypothetical protein
MPLSTMIDDAEANYLNCLQKIHDSMVFLHAADDAKKARHRLIIYSRERIWLVVT